jgi:hydroxyacylglutathione hydrolase
VAATVLSIPCLSDNYAYLVVCDATGESAIVDASEAGPVAAAVEREKRRPAAVWSTHHHHDHVGGNEEIVKRLAVRDVFGHASDKGRIPAQTRFLETGDTFTLGELSVRAIHIPGHTLGAVAYVVDGDPPCVFTGDTLFLAGCGRLFEGTPAMMHASLARLAELPPETRVYCGHEYTESNLRFAAHVEPSNADVAAGRTRVAALRARGEASVPGTIGEERRTNPFLRESSPEIRRTLGVAEGADAVTAFAAIRSAKDSFR